MRRRILSAVLVALMGGSLAITPATSQDADFTIDPSVGLPGDEVDTLLDPDALAASDCYLTPAQVQGETGPLAQLAGALAAAGDEADLDDNQAVVAQVLPGIVGTLANPLLAAQVEEILASFFVLTFADIGTMAPVGDRSNFDPETGEGMIVVPELDPGLWAVVATCVFPAVTSEAAYLAALDGVVAALVDYFELEEGETLSLQVIGGILQGQDQQAAAMLSGAILQAALPALVAPQDQWTAPFTIPAPLPVADPAVAAFCAAIPQLPALGEELLTALAALPEDDGTMTQEEWADAADWEAIGAELEGLVGDIEELLEAGDTSRPDEVADAWASATAPLRQLRDALQAVDYDLSTESGRMIAGQLRDQATAPDDGEGDPSVATLTEWFVANCIPEPVPAPAAQPTTVQPRYTG